RAGERPPMTPTRGQGGQVSGSRRPLLAPRPLRTGRASFPASGSSLRERLLRDAAGSVTRVLAVPLPVAVGMEQLQVVQAITAPPGSLYPMLHLPLFLFPQQLAASRAAPLLFSPQVTHLCPSGQRALHPSV